jgi:DNA mismatch repair protein MutS
VAQLAGIPQSVVKAARKHLAFLEAQAAAAQPQGDLFTSAPARAEPEPEPADHPALARLRDLDPDGLSPREALELLYALKKLAG